jgi:hypothetical protein
MSRTLDVVYLAGFFDGEGCITVTVNNKGYAYVMIETTQRVREPLDLMKATFGSSGEVRPIKGGKYWGLRYNGTHAEAVLRELLPYLRVKREQAELALRFRDGDQDATILELKRLKRA